MTDDVWSEFEERTKQPAPPEPDAKRTKKVDAADIYDIETQAYVFLLAILVERLGGAVAISAEDRMGVVNLGIDQSEMDTTGVIRLFTAREA